MRRSLVIMAAVLLLLHMVSAVWALKLERPANHLDIKQRDENAFTNGKASVGLGVSVDQYVENWQDYGGADFINMNVSMTSNSRMGITYDYCWQGLWWIPENELWYNNTVNIFGDDAVAQVNIPQDEGIFKIRFYGGCGSAEYDKVYVSTNGFISFHDSTQPSPIPSNIPSSAGPNAIVAAVWTDLEIDSNAQIITGLWPMASQWYFVVIWKNVKAGGERLTFEIILKRAPGPAQFYDQSQIWISYGNVGSIDTDFAVGIEDQQGGKGTGWLRSGSSLPNFDGRTLNFGRYGSRYFLKQLTINLLDSNSETRLRINRPKQFIRGYNVKFTGTPSPDTMYRFARVLAGTATLLVSAATFGGGWIAASGLLVGTVLVGLDWVDFLAYNQYDSVDVYDLKDQFGDSPIPAGAYIIVPTLDYRVDATLGIVVHWVLDTPNDVSHSLTITANLEYYEYTTGGQMIDKPPITTSVNLEIGPDDNDNFATADPIDTGVVYPNLYIGSNDGIDYYKFHADAQFVIDVWAEAPSSDPHPNFYVDLYDPGENGKAGSGGYGRSHCFTFTADSTGDWFVKVRRHDNFGFYLLKVWVHAPGCGGCPYVSVWNGTQYAIDNNLLAESEHSNGIDVVDYYRLEQASVPRFESRSFSLHSLMISEFENEHSYLDQVRFLAVDHSSDVNIAVSLHGDILTYTNPYASISAIDDKGDNVAHLVNSIDGDCYEGCNGSYVTLDFGDLDISQGAKLVIRADYPKVVAESIHIQIQDIDGTWKTVETIIPRVNWATEIIDMSEYLSHTKDNLEVRLYLTANHKIDYAGLDTSPQATVHVKRGSLVLAKRSANGCVTSLLRHSDSKYAELLPGQNIKLFFALRKQTAQFRTYIVVAEGHYETITT